MLAELFDTLRPQFAKSGRLKALYPVFFTAEHIILPPLTRVTLRPFARDAIEIKRYMTMVIVALLPALAAAVHFFGPRILAMVLVSYTVGGITELLFALIRKEEINEGFLVSGLIFPLVLPPTAPLWIVAVGVLAGIVFGKEVFGGTGRNIFNPALVGRLFITISFPAIMTTRWREPLVDAITTATPLALYKTEGILTSSLDLLLGRVAGSAGETFSLGIIVGGLFLMATRVANWRIPLSFLGTVALLAAIGAPLLPGQIAPPHFQLLTGGLLFGAMFMATDPVSSPLTREGKYLFGAGCGLITVLIRSFSGYVEGVMFSIVLMNAFVPLIDHLVLSLTYKPRQVPIR